MSDIRQEQLRSLAARYGVSIGAVEVLAIALARSGGRQAQFNHPELGGMGQWQPGMIMIGDMFNHALKARVDGLAGALSGLINVGNTPGGFEPMTGFEAAWWPSVLGTPDSAGGQNDLSYAYFAHSNRLLIKHRGQITTYDTIGQRVTGVSQQQMNGVQTIVFSTAHGVSNINVLRVIR